MTGTVLFDGNCNLCDRLAWFLRRHDRMNRFRFVPPFIRDWIYSLVAGNRSRLFGKKDYC